MTIEIDSAASAEVEDAARWYEKERPGLGVEFLSEVDRAFATIARMPATWPVWPNLPVALTTDVRRYLVKRFPFAVAYQARENRIVILAVAHTSRRPGYWIERIERER